MIITFLGHRSIPNCEDIAEKIEKTILENIDENTITLFYCGGYGDFDNTCARVCHSIKKKYPYCEVVFITPYISNSIPKKIDLLMKSNIYDSVIYPPLEKVPLKFAIIKRNEWMINEADLIIAYVDFTFGGAYNSMKYAEKKKKRIINLAELT